MWKVCSLFLMSYRLLHKTQSTGNRPLITPIHILDNDSLLEIFFLCRPLTWDESESTNDETFDEGGRNCERWWYTFVHVCRRWRYLMLECASHLHLSLVCARGTPVAAMLANSLPFPIIIDHFDQRYGITAGDEQGIILAPHHRDRVRHIRLRNPISLLQKFIIALNGEFPILEDLLIQNRSYPILANMSLNIPKTFRAPHLRHLMLIGFDIPLGSPLNTTMGNLVTLNLDLIATTLTFSEYYLHIMAYPREGARVHTFSISLHGIHLNWQVASAEIFHAIGTVFSAVEHLTLQYDRYFLSPMWDDESYGTQWRELLRTFINVKTISIDDRLIGQLSRSLQPFDGESSTELLFELQELTCYSTDASRYTFTQFIDARHMQVAQ